MTMSSLEAATRSERWWCTIPAYQTTFTWDVSWLQLLILKSQ